MDPARTDDQELLRATARRFLDAQMPLTRVRELAAEPSGFDRRWWRDAATLGWTSLLVDEEHGGGSVSGCGLLDLLMVAEELGRTVAPGPLVPSNVVAWALAREGASAGAGVLAGVLSGDTITAWAFAEPKSPWITTRLATVATAVDGGYSLTGVKTYVEAGAEADHLLVTAAMGEGVSQFLVPAAASGVTVGRLEALDTTRRYATVRLDDVRLPAAAMVGEPGGSARAVERQLELALVLQCAETNGAVDRVFEFTLEYMAERYSFGRPLASYQALKHRVADMKLWLETCHATTTAAARAVQRDDPSSPELVSAMKAFVGQYSTAIVQECVQLHGGIGVTWEHDLHLYLRRVTTNRQMYGGPLEHRARIADMMGV